MRSVKHLAFFNPSPGPTVRGLRGGDFKTRVNIDKAIFMLNFTPGTPPLYA